MEIRDIFFALSLTASLPVIACSYVWSKIDRQNFVITPVFVCTLLGLLVEIISYRIHDSRTFNSLANFYLLAELILLQWQLYCWNHQLSKKYVGATAMILFLTWLISNFYFGQLVHRNAVYNFVHALSIIMSCIMVINGLTSSNKPISRRFQFLFCVALLLFFTFNIAVEMVCAYHKLFTQDFIKHIFSIKSMINVITNILMAVSILCIPRKQKYTLSF